MHSGVRKIQLSSRKQTSRPFVSVRETAPDCSVLIVCARNIMSEELAYELEMQASTLLNFIYFENRNTYGKCELGITPVFHFCLPLFWKYFSHRYVPDIGRNAWRY
jgi:hypothetical protein